MKLYDGGRAPNPRRVKVFLAEKGITVPTEQVDLGKLAHKSPPIPRSIRCSECRRSSSTMAPSSANRSPYAGTSNSSNPSRALFGTGAKEMAMVEMWERRIEFHLLGPISHVFRNSHPAMKEMEVPQVPAWAEANKPRVMDFLALLDRELGDSPLYCRRALQRGRHHRNDRGGLHEARQARHARGPEQPQTLA